MTSSSPTLTTALTPTYPDLKEADMDAQMDAQRTDTDDKTPAFTPADIDQFRETLTRIEEAFRDYCEVKGIKDAWSYEFDSIDDDGIHFSYIEWGYEPRYDGWETHEQTMPLAFLTDRDRIAAEITAEREEQERQEATAKAAKETQRREEREAKERAQLAKLQAKYGGDS
jgi:hypothetical protein